MRFPRPGLPLVAAVALALTLAAPASRAGEPLAPHAAQYRLSLHSGGGSGGVAAVKGRLEVRFEASCDGWRLEQSLGFRMMAEDGTGLEHLAYLVGFEERDGSTFTFDTRTWEDRELVEKVSGVVRKDPATGAVSVRYATPQAATESLPTGTLFPGEHVTELLALARRGGRSMMRSVFDGSTAENPYQISAWIGPPRAPDPADPPALAQRRSWPVRLAYFARSAVEPQPDFEMSLRLFDNGVAGDMIYDYDDFSIDVTLETVELLAEPRCP